MRFQDKRLVAPSCVHLFLHRARAFMSRRWRDQIWPDLSSPSKRNGDTSSGLSDLYSTGFNLQHKEDLKIENCAVVNSRGISWDRKSQFELWIFLPHEGADTSWATHFFLIVAQLGNQLQDPLQMNIRNQARTLSRFLSTWFLTVHWRDPRFVLDSSPTAALFLFNMVAAVGGIEWTNLEASSSLWKFYNKY